MNAMKSSSVNYQAVERTRRKLLKKFPWISVYTSTIILIGVMVGWAAFQQIPANWLWLLVFALTAASAEIMSVELFPGSRTRISLSSFVALSGILVFGPLSGVLIHALSGLFSAISTSLRQENLPDQGRASMFRRSAFNMSMFAISSAAAGGVYVLAGGVPGSVADSRNLFPLILAATVDVVINVVILLPVIGMQTGERLVSIFRQNFQWSMPITVLGGIVAGGGLALAYGLLGGFGFAFFLLPVLATNYSFQVYVDNMKVNVAQLRAANQQLDAANVGLLEALGAVIDADDSYTAGHSRQVAIYAGALAEELNLDAAAKATVVKAALVHDIGKVGIDDQIVRKPGKLTAEEFAIMQKHTVIGAEILGRTPGLAPLVPLVRHHHERWDGKGYPDGIAGEAIPIGARILALSDSLDAMCSDRPYRDRLSYEAVLAEVTRCTGSQFDPEVTNALFAIAEAEGASFFKNSAAHVAESLATSRTKVMFTDTHYLKRSMIEEI